MKDVGPANGSANDSEESFDALLRQAAETPQVASIRSIQTGSSLAGGRFVIERMLGEGGMGVVFEARDTKTASRVALKILSRIDAAGIYRLKKEFRSLADVAHENLVGLHELFADGDEWFFTMDLVDGVPFTEYVRTDPALGFEATLSSDPQGAPLDATLEMPGGVMGSRGSGALRETRLREVLRQLVAAVSAIHGAGKVHRDLKPSNVLVTRGGRVVILDFGLAGSMRGGHVTETLDHTFAGTPGYMAPEQIRGDKATPASDWYAVGVMLYEALTGKLPFPGTVQQVLAGKLERDPAAPAELAPAVPDDLANLCMQLLDRDPRKRATAESIGSCIGSQSSEPVDVPVDGAPPFVGRERELGALDAARRAVRDGEPRTVFVHGASGIGKSALLDRFVASLGPEVNVLRSRCYEREALPYKAFDGVVDGVCRYLGRIDRGQAGALLPRDVHSLTRLFPVMRRVDVIARAEGRHPSALEPLEMRRRAFSAFKELLARLGDRRALVLVIDDLQWADLDSAHLLADLVAPPDAPAMSILCAYRSDEVARSECLSALLDPARETFAAQLTELRIDPLSPSEARSLAAALLHEPSHARAEAIARESEGSPYFIAEIARQRPDSTRAGSDAEPGRTLDEAIERRIERLPHDARRLLEVISVSGRPIPASLALAAAELDSAHRGSVVLLCASHLARTTGEATEPILEVYHDRLREAVLRVLDGEAIRRWHAALAHALSAAGATDAERLAEHLAGAGRTQQAVGEAIRAARDASASFAYERAARLLRLAVQWMDDGEDRQRTRRMLAEALTKAGRDAESGWAYLEAADGAPADEQLKLRRLAAERLALSGHIGEAIGLFAGVLAAHGETSPGSRQQAVNEATQLFAVLGERRLDIELRAAAEIPPAQLEKIDLLWSVAWGTNATAYGTPFAIRHLLAALDAGEPRRLVRGLAQHAWGLASLGLSDAEAVAAAERAAADSEDPYVRAWSLLAKWGAVWRGEWRTAMRYTDEMESALRNLPEVASREFGVARMGWSRAALNAGELAELRRRLRRWIADAEARNDLGTATSLRYDAAMLHLAADNPHAALAEVERSWERSKRSKSDYFLHGLRLPEGHVRLYVGSPADLRLGIDELGAALENSSIRQTTGRFAMQYLRAAHRLRLAEQTDDRAKLLDECDGEAAHLVDNAIVGWVPRSLALRAGVAHLRADRETTLRVLDEVAALSDGPEGNRVLGACARRRKGQLAGGQAGRRLVEEADTRMRAETIANPARWAALYVPGFPDLDGRT